MNDIDAIRQRRIAAAGETVLHAGRVLADVDALLAEVTRLGRELGKMDILRHVEGDRLQAENADLRRQVRDLEELLRMEEARG